ncbi:MAG: hypothetical protein AABW54_01845 [Candidatus Micrarchaeota archaeon]
MRHLLLLVLVVSLLLPGCIQSKKASFVVCPDGAKAANVELCRSLLAPAVENFSDANASGFGFGSQGAGNPAS